MQENEGNGKNQFVFESLSSTEETNTLLVKGYPKHQL